MISSGVLLSAASLAPFVSFETDSIVLEPGSSEEIEIKIDNRDSLSPGGHYAAIVVRNVEVRETENQKILPAISALLLVRKTGGEEFNITIRDIGWNPTLSFKIPEEIVIQFENNGNVHDIPRGTVKITDMFGRVVYQGILNENSSYLLPDNIRSIPIKMKRSRFLFPIQLLSLEIRGTSEIGSVPIQAEISFVYFDYRLVVFVFIVVIFSFILVRRNKKIKKINEKK